MNPENNEEPVEQVESTPVVNTAYQTGPTLQENDTAVPQTLLSRTKVIHLAYALVVGIVGFGSCLLNLSSVDDGFLYVFPSIVYLISAVFALSSIIAVSRINPVTGEPYSAWMQIFVLVTGTAIGGWSAYWGIYGTLLGLGIMEFPCIGC